MNKKRKEERIREQKIYILSHGWDKKKARKMLPRVAVHLGEAK